MTDIDGNPNFDRSFELGISFPSFIQLEIASSTSRLEYLAFFVFKTFQMEEKYFKINLSIKNNFYWIIKRKVEKYEFN